MWQTSRPIWMSRHTPATRVYKLIFTAEISYKGFWSLMEATSTFSSNTDLDIGLWKDYFERKICLGLILPPRFKVQAPPTSILSAKGNWILKLSWEPPACIESPLIVLMEYDHLIEMSHDGDIISEPSIAIKKGDYSAVIHALNVCFETFIRQIPFPQWENK